MGELLFDEIRTLDYYDDDGDYYGYFNNQTADISILKQGTVIHCYIYYDNTLMKEGNVVLGTESDTILYDYSNVPFGLSFSDYSSGVADIYPNASWPFGSLESMPLKEWRFVAELSKESSDNTLKSIEYIKKTLPHSLNWNILIQLFAEDGIEVTEEIRTYLNTTSWNTNTKVFESLIRNNSDT